jgi:hypothetical protein
MLATGAGGTNQSVVARTHAQPECKLNMAWLAQSFSTLSLAEYFTLAVAIMADEIKADRGSHFLSFFCNMKCTVRNRNNNLYLLSYYVI